MLSVNGPEGPLAAHIPFLSRRTRHDRRPAPCPLQPHRPRRPARARADRGLGPDAYISPDWYGAPDQVPTWNYVAVHLRGTLHALPVETLRDHADALSARFEADLLPKTPWVSTKMTEGVMERMMRMILPFRLRSPAIDGTWKLNQNKPPEMRHAGGRRARGAGRRGPGADARPPDARRSR